MAEFKDIIAKLRSENQMSQQTLADKLDVSKSTIAMWETGKRFPSKELYEQIADLFCVDIDYLFGRTDARQMPRFDKDGNPYYYINEETSKIAQEIFEHKELRLLFDAARDAEPEDLNALHNMLLALKRKEQHYDD